MKLNHINLYSADIDGDCALFERHFGLRVRHSEPGRLAVMADDGDMIFVVNAFGKKPFAYPDEFIRHHIGFVQPDAAAVNAVHRRLADDGWTVQEPRAFHGVWTFYFRAPGGFWIEVTTATVLEPD